MQEGISKEDHIEIKSTLDSLYIMIDKIGIEPPPFSEAVGNAIKWLKVIINEDLEPTTDSKSLLRVDSIIKDELKHPGLSPNEKELLKYRLQQLSGGIAILRVGAATESELIERWVEKEEKKSHHYVKISYTIYKGV